MSHALPTPVGVVIATKGRPDVAGALTSRLLAQTLPPVCIAVVATDPADLPVVASPQVVSILHDRAGSSAQRNRGLDALAGRCRHVAFFDDDFVPAEDWLEKGAAVLDADPSIAGVTGHVLSDGIHGPGIAWDAGVAIVEAADPEPATAPTVEARPYGCNMMFRMEAVGQERFDERLVLYGWQEDTDFGSRVGCRGRIVRAPSLRGVHLGLKRGRVPATKLGYSQVSNVAYLMKKGTMPPAFGLSLIGRNMLRNLLGALAPEPHVDRRGRLRGNLIGCMDVLAGRLTPERAEAL